MEVYVTSRVVPSHVAGVHIIPLPSTLKRPGNLPYVLSLRFLAWRPTVEVWSYDFFCSLIPTSAASAHD